MECVLSRYKIYNNFSSENERKIKQKHKQFLRGTLLIFIVTIFLLLIGQKTKNSGFDWFI